MKKLICAVIVLAVSTAQAGVVLRVDAVNCPGPGDGSELDPYCSIQTAIDNAVDNDEVADEGCNPIGDADVCLGCGREIGGERTYPPT